jgi:hypothetical protein
MRETGNRLSRRLRLILIIATPVLIMFFTCSAHAGRIVESLLPLPNNRVIETGIAPIADGSDSVLCDGDLLRRGDDYEMNLLTGRLTFVYQPVCDSIVLIAFQLPAWMVEPVGNPVPRGSKRIYLETNPGNRPSRPVSSPRKITLSGNKSFFFNVGRSGEGRFSQGLNIDFDALLTCGLRARGSVSDRIGSTAAAIPGSGGTTLLSELDKYFFEIEGRKVTVRGGDINASAGPYLPAKKIKGVYASFKSENFNLAGDVGRPAGRFASRNIRGVDGRQGPYQARGNDGLPTAVVPGSEKVYLDGRLLEGGSDKHYMFDYSSGRITFSPRVLITSRSRIEIDFEAAENNYEQVVYDAIGGVGGVRKKFSFSAGFRRESDDKERLRFGSYTPAEVCILQNAGDSTSGATRSGVAADPDGDYESATDSFGVEYYRYVGSGSGEYKISFSFVGEGQGDYSYLGAGIYQYAGKGGGDYLPIIYLPLPVRNDYLFAAMIVSPYSKGTARLEYQGNIRDQNLFSDLDDSDNFKSRVAGSFFHRDSSLNVGLNFYFRQDDYKPFSRLKAPDYNRLWALPQLEISGDELGIETDNSFKYRHNRFKAGYGYLRYKDNLRSRRLMLEAHLLENESLSPRITYQSGNSESLSNPSQKGLYEKLNAGAALKLIEALGLDFDLDRELSKDRFGPEPDVEKYLRYRGTAFFANTVLAASRRIDFRSGVYGFRGPQSDKIELTSDENLGRLRISVAGAWLDQKRLDSDRQDRRERLFQTSFSYSPAGGWLSLQAEYRQNRQSARSSEYRYVHVNSGEGNYRFEDGQYLSDPDGDYIRIREETGQATSILVGEKSHNIVFYPGRLPVTKSYKNILSQIAFRLRTEITEELPGRDRHHISWLLPWVSHSGLNYLNRRRREGYSVLLFPMFNFYILNLSCSHVFEEQEGGSQLNRNRKEYDTQIKNRLSPEVRTNLKWHHVRSKERGVGLVSLDLISNEYIIGLIINQGRFQLMPQIAHVRFSDDLSGGRGRGVWISAETVYRRRERGEIRFHAELRSVAEKRKFNQPEYQVTGGKRFGESALLGLIGSYDIGKSMRLTVNLTDRIFEDRPAEFVGRGELVARF